MTPAVTVNEPGSAFGWLGKLGGVPHLFDGAHRFELQPIDGGDPDPVRPVGAVPGDPAAVRPPERPAADLAGFEAMNRALAERVVAMKASPA